MMSEWRNLIGAIVLAALVTGCAHAPVIGGAMNSSKCDALLGEWQLAGSKEPGRLRCVQAKNSGVAYQLWGTKDAGKKWQLAGSLKVYIVQGKTWIEVLGAGEVKDPLQGIVAFPGHDQVNLRVLDPGWLYNYARMHPDVLPYREAKNSSLEITITASPQRWAHFLEKTKLPEKALTTPFVFRRVQPSAGFAMPYSLPADDGFVMSAYAPDKGLVDVRQFRAGERVRDPFTGRIFITPPRNNLAVQSCGSCWHSS